MSRSVLAAWAVLVVLVACRDGPTQVAAPAEASRAPQPDPIISVDALQAATDMLDDPFVRELMDRVGLQLDVSPHSSGTDPSMAGSEHGILALSRSLTEARDQLRQGAYGDGAEEDPDEVIIRDILLLVLDDAVVLLESPSPREERGEPGRDVVQHEERGAN